jgi:hypothetical protein
MPHVHTTAGQAALLVVSAAAASVTKPRRRLCSTSPPGTSSTSRRPTRNCRCAASASPAPRAWPPTSGASSATWTRWPPAGNPLTRAAALAACRWAAAGGSRSVDVFAGSGFGAISLLGQLAARAHKTAKSEHGGRLGHGVMVTGNVLVIVRHDVSAAVLLNDPARNGAVPMARSRWRPVPSWSASLPSWPAGSRPAPGRRVSGCGVRRRAARRDGRRTIPRRAGCRCCSPCRPGRCWRRTRPPRKGP